MGGVLEFAVLVLLVGAIVLLLAPKIMGRRRPGGSGGFGGGGGQLTPGTLLVTGVSAGPDSDGSQYVTLTGVINGMKNLPASFTPGRRLGPGLDETIEMMQRLVDEQRLAEPESVRKKATQLSD